MPSSVAQSGSPQSDSVQIPDTLLSDVHFTKLETVQPYLEQGSIPIPPPAGIVSALNGYIQNRHLFVKDDEEFGSLTDAATRLLEEVKGSNRVRNQDLVDMVGNKLEGRFKKFDEIFKKFDERFNKIDERFDKTDERFKKFDERFNKIDERFNKTDERFKKFDERFNKFEETFEKKWDTREKTLDTKLGDIQKSLERLENELNGIGWKQLIGNKGLNVRGKQLMPVRSHLSGESTPNGLPAMKTTTDLNKLKAPQLRSWLTLYGLATSGSIVKDRSLLWSYLISSIEEDLE